MKTAILNHRKRKAGQRSDLSLKELVIRTRRIESCLDGEIEQKLLMMAELAGSSPSPEPSSADTERKYIATKVTRIYAWTTLIYLHVIVSGLNPQVPEI